MLKRKKELQRFEDDINISGMIQSTKYHFITQGDTSELTQEEVFQEKRGAGFSMRYLLFPLGFFLFFDGGSHPKL